MPPGPLCVAEWLAQRAKADSSSQNTKSRACAVDWVCQMAGVPSPSNDQLVQLTRGSIRKQCGRRNVGKLPLFSSDLQRASSLLSGSPDQEAGHVLLSVMQEAKLRADCIVEVELGGLAAFPDRVAIGLHGTKGDRLREGQLGYLPQSESPSAACNLLWSLLQKRAEGLLALPAERLAALIAKFSQAIPGASGGSTRAAPLPETMTLFPAAVLQPLSRLAELGLRVERLPLCGAWLTTEAEAVSDLGRLAGYKFLLGASKAVATVAGLDPARYGTHSARKGGAEQLLDSGASPFLASRGLRHKNVRTLDSYVMTSSIGASLVAAHHASPLPPPLPQGLGRPAPGAAVSAARLAGSPRPRRQDRAPGLPGQRDAEPAQPAAVVRAPSPAGGVGRRAPAPFGSAAFS